jgi:hypothetical protein
LESAVAAARARQAEAELALVAAQQDLAEAAPAITSASPLPSDSPFVGVYRTNFTAIYANKTPPPGLKRIDRTLPVIQRLIDARTTAVNKERAALHSVTDAYERGQVLLPHVLDSFLQLRQQQIAFLAAVRDYNYSIADYAVSVFTPDLGREAVVSMLIENPSSNSPSRSILSPRRESQPARETLPSAAPTSERTPSTASLPRERIPFQPVTPATPTNAAPAPTGIPSPSRPASGFSAPNTPPPAAAAYAPRVADTSPLLTRPTTAGASTTPGAAVTYPAGSPASSGTFAPSYAPNPQTAPAATGLQFRR